MSDLSDPSDRATLESERDLERALTAHRNRVRPAKAATARSCCDCSEAIPPRRLAAHPEASRCIECARRFELRLKHLKRH